MRKECKEIIYIFRDVKSITYKKAFFIFWLFTQLGNICLWIQFWSKFCLTSQGSTSSQQLVYWSWQLIMIWFRTMMPFWTGNFCHINLRILLPLWSRFDNENINKALFLSLIFRNFRLYLEKYLKGLRNIRIFLKVRIQYLYMLLILDLLHKQEKIACKIVI